MPLKVQLLTTQGGQWVGWCKHKLEALQSIRKPGEIIKQAYSLPGNIMAKVLSSDVCDIITIWGGAGGFISHPRTVLHPGGLTPSGKDISSVLQFPLIDNDHGSYNIGLEGKGTPTTAENYGNIAYVSTEGVVTWRGPSGGYILNDPSLRITGLTNQYEDYVLYTPLSKNLYQGGAVLAALAGVIRCAAVIKGVYWIVMNLGGVDELCYQKNGKWVVIGTRPTELYLGTAVPCIFQDNKVILQKGEWTLAGVWTSYETALGKLTRNGTWDITETAEGIILQPGVNASFKQSDKTTVYNNFSNTYGNISAYIVSGGPLVVSGPAAPVDGSQYTVSGGNGPYTWSISQGNISNSGVVSGINSLCGSAVITVKDTCGVTVTYPVRLPTGGSWQYSTGQFPANTSPWNLSCGGGAWCYDSAILRYTLINTNPGSIVTSCNNNPSGIHPNCTELGYPNACAGAGYPQGPPPAYNTWTYNGSGGQCTIVQWNSTYTNSYYEVGGVCWVALGGDYYTGYTYTVEVWQC